MLALDHHHLDHTLPGVDLIQALLQLLLLKLLLIQDESNASNLKVPTYKSDSSVPLRATTALKVSLASQFNVLLIGYKYYAFISQAEFTMSEIRWLPGVRK